MKKNIKKASNIILFTASLVAGLFALPAFASAPYAVTYDVVYVSGNCAVVSGYATSDRAYDVFFEVKEGANSHPWIVRTEDFITTSGSIYYGSEVKNLKPNTQYFYRSVVDNRVVMYGQEKTFTTKSYENNNQDGCAQYVPLTKIDDNYGTFTNTQTQYTYGNGNQNSYPATSVVNNIQKVETLNATNIYETSARLNGVTYPTQNVPQYGKFVWGKTTSFGNETPRVALGSGAKLFLAQDIQGLAPGTTYYYKAIVDNQFGVSEGGTMMFTTAGNASKVISTATTHTISKVATKTTTNKTAINKTATNTTKTTDNKNDSSTNTAAAGFASNSSLFCGPYSTWFSLLSLLILFITSYFSWKYFLLVNGGEDEEKAPDTLDLVPETVPQKPIEMNVKTTKSAPPDNLPV